MSNAQSPSRPRSGAALKARELRRLVELLESSSIERRAIEPLSQMIPGLSMQDARMIRDEVLRRGLRPSSHLRSVCAGGAADPVIVGDHLLSESTANIMSGTDKIQVQALAGIRARLESLNAGGDFQIVIGALVARDPFNGASTSAEDLVGVNGGAIRLATSTVSTPSSGTHSLEYRVLHSGVEIESGVIAPSENLVRESAQLLDEARKSCSPFEQPLSSSWSESATGIVLPLKLGALVSLDSGSTITLEVDGAPPVIVTTDTSKFSYREIQE